MPADYLMLLVVAVLSIGGALFLLHQAKNYRKHRTDVARSSRK